MFHRMAEVRTVAFGVKKVGMVEGRREAAPPGCWQAVSWRAFTTTRSTNRPLSDRLSNSFPTIPFHLTSLHTTLMIPSNALPLCSNVDNECSATETNQTSDLLHLSQHETLSLVSSQKESTDLLFHINSAAVGFMLNNQVEEAVSLFHQGLETARIPGLLYANASPSSPTLQADAQQTHHKVPSLPSQPSLSQCTDESILLTSVDAEYAPAPQVSLPTRDSTYSLYNRALLFGNGIAKGPTDTNVLSHHITPVLLYNFGLMVHQRARSEADFLLAHELYRTSLFLMEENSIHGLYHKTFDLLLLALFNNLCELNSVFHQRTRVAMCREKLLQVFLNMDTKQVPDVDYSFFYEQLVFSSEQFPTAAPAA